MSSSILNTKQSVLYSLIAASTLALAGCDGGSLDNNSNTDIANDSLAPSRDSEIIEGNLISTRSSGAQVCIDVNRNGQCDRLEPNTLAASDGSFHLIPAKTPGPILAELLADENNTALTLFADFESDTISALTTVLHWSGKSNPTLEHGQIVESLKSLLSVDDLDSVAPQQVTTIILPSDELDNPSDDTSNLEENLDIPLDQTLSPPAQPSQVDIVRRSIEKLISNIDAAAMIDALAAGLDPGLDVNKVLLSRLVADQTLKQLPALADEINDNIDPDPQLIADALPAPQWPANNIVLALQLFAGDLPTEADPITLLKASLLNLTKDCETGNDCALHLTRMDLDDDLNLSVTNSALLASGGAVNIPLNNAEISNLVLNREGEWQALDSSGMAEITRASEFRAAMTDGNDIRSELRATSQNLRDAPVAPFLDNLGLDAEDLPEAQDTFSSGAMLVTLQRTQIDDRFEIRFEPSKETHDHAVAAQALAQAELNLDRTQKDHKTAEDALRELLFISEQSDATATADAAEVDALERAIEAIESSLQEANVALSEAENQSAAIEESASLISAFESVVSDAMENVDALEAAESEAKSNVSTAETAQAEAATVLADTNATLEAAIANAEADAEISVDDIESTDNDNGLEADSTSQNDAAAVEAEADQLQAERDLIVAEATLAENMTTLEIATSELNQAMDELASAEASLSEARGQQLADGDAESVLQAAQLLVDANESNLNLVNGQIAEAKLISDISAQQASDDLAAVEAARANADQLESRLVAAIDELSEAQALASTTGISATSGCAATLPLQAEDNYNCLALERQIGDSPSSVVQTLAELTSTSSTLTLLNLHPDFAATLLPADGATSGQIVWHSLEDTFAPNVESQPSSQWVQETINGTSLITVELPEELREAGQASELLMAEHDNYVRPGVVIKAGEIVSETLLNDKALGALLP